VDAQGGGFGGQGRRTRAHSVPAIPRLSASSTSSGTASSSPTRPSVAQGGSLRRRASSRARWSLALPGMRLACPFGLAISLAEGAFCLGQGGSCSAVPGHGPPRECLRQAFRPLHDDHRTSRNPRIPVSSVKALRYVLSSVMPGPGCPALSAATGRSPALPQGVGGSRSGLSGPLLATC
jgi:hypothetical protein